MKNEDAESVIATTIGSLSNAVSVTPVFTLRAKVIEIKEYLKKWYESKSTTNISDTCAIRLIRELSDRNDDAAYRQAVKEIVEQCD